MTRRLLVLLLLLDGCGTDAGGLAAVPPRDEPVSAELQASCELAQRRCARCHTTGRITQTRVAQPRDWQRYVHRMRLMPGSAIPPTDEAPITRCLVFRAFGTKGLAELGDLP